MKTCIFIVSFPRDYEMLKWAVNSIHKFVVGSFDIVVVHPEGTNAPDVAASCRTVSEPAGKGFLTQMIVKCEPDKYAPGYDSYIHWDSDCIITKATPVHEFRNVCYYGAYNTILKKAPHLGLWRSAVHNALGLMPVNEFMRCFPISFPALLYPSMRKRIELFVKKPFAEYVFSCRNEFPQTFAEFNTLGAWGWIEHRKQIDFRPWERGPSWGWPTLHQYHGPSGPDHRMQCSAANGHTARETATRLGLL